MPYFVRLLSVTAMLVTAATATAAADVLFRDALKQGALVRGTVPPGTSMTVDGRGVPVSPDGAFVFGLGRDAPPEVRLFIQYADGRQEITIATVEQRDYDVQRIDGLPPGQVSPSKKKLQRIAREQAILDSARQNRLPLNYFKQGFAWPVTGRVSGVYGSQRILNGKPRNPHLGVDVAAPEGTPIAAPASGIVTVVHDGMFFSGKTVILNHGYGVTSIYIHMSEVLVREGDLVEQGEYIGQVGMTGRATGPHLHWGVNWFEIKLDPALLVGPMPSAPKALDTPVIEEEDAAGSQPGQ